MDNRTRCYKDDDPQPFREGLLGALKGPQFWRLETVLLDPNVKLVSKKRAERTFNTHTPPRLLFLAKILRKPASGREPGFNHLRNLRPSTSQEDAKPHSWGAPVPIVSEPPKENSPVVPLSLNDLHVSGSRF